VYISRTPYRLSLAGGGTDFPVWFCENKGTVLTGSINKYSYITCNVLKKFFDHNYRIVYSLIENVQEIDEIKHPAVREIIRLLKFETELEIHHHGDLPARTGVGSSSAFSVGLLHLISFLQDCKISKHDLAKLAIKVEREILNENVGMQDQIACAYGGINKIDFFYKDSQPDYKVYPVPITKKRSKLLSSQIKLVYTGKQRFSTRVSSTLLRTLTNQNRKTLKLQNRNVELAVEVEKILVENYDLIAIADIFEESWSIKKQLNPDSVTKELEDIKRLGIKAGSKGAKMLGAGGGGFIAFWVDPEHELKFATGLKNFTVIDFEFEDQGSQIIYSSK
jgi:D-glycero-alpha-D-manno-heptose-7-phosphate kinase